MRSKCCVVGCKSATYNKFGYQLKFHKFPKDPERLALWKKLCQNPCLANRAHNLLWICSLHFTKSCYFNNLLKPDAVPTLHLPLQSIIDWNVIDQGTSTKTTNHGVSGQEMVITEETKDKPTQDVKQEASDEDDDCESVNFSSSEDENDETKQANWDKGDSTSENTITIEQGDSVDQILTALASSGSSKTSAPAAPVYANLPVISAVSTITDVHSTPRQQPRSAVNLDDDVEDDCSTFAAHIKARMRNLDVEQKIIAQKLISDVLFMADTKQLQLDSSVVNTAPVVTKTPMKPTGGTFFAYVDSDDDEPSVKRPK